jgi:hypothetical protein
LIIVPNPIKGKRGIRFPSRERKGKKTMGLSPESKSATQRQHSVQMQISPIVTAVSVSPLILIVIVGVILLFTDTILQKFAPGHYAGLTAFTAISAAVLVATSIRPKRGLLVAWGWNIVYLALLVGDLIFGASFGLSSGSPVLNNQPALNAYLLGLPLFDSLIAIQILSVFLTAWAISKFHRS